MAINWTLIIAVFTVAGAVVGGLIKIFGSKQKSGCRDCFRDIQRKLEDHESRITVSETEIKGIFESLKEIKGDIKEILSLLRGK